jgi:N-acetylglucosaminyldiphosphoundecaprenol N-acetyl-beta-D-mannosaminyltransferase
MPTASIDILGVRVNPLTVDELHTAINSYIRSKAHALILHVNVHCLNLSCESSWLREFLNQSDLVFCDGAGIQMAARVFGRSLPMRITYADWMWQLAELCAQEGHTLFLLGARPGIAKIAASRLQFLYPELRIVGTHHGYFDKTPDSTENEAVIEQINAVKPHILLVGLGMPVQERWLMENWERIDANVALTGGAVFDYISGELRRAPRWMTDHGLEWLGRLLIEPRRLWRRYVVGNPLFLWRVLKQRFGLLRL